MQLISIIISLGTALALVPDLWINLKEPANQRYSHLFPTYTNPLKGYANAFVNKLKLDQSILLFFDNLSQTHPDQELVEDTRAISILSGIPFNVLYAMQFMYDFGSATGSSIVGCTSIIVDPIIGDPYIVRNLDYGFKEEILPLTARVIYYNGNKSDIAMISMAIVGQLSVTHSITTKYAAITIDQLKSNFGKDRLIQAIGKTKHNSVIRELYLAARDSLSYSELQTRLNTTTTNAHAYAIMVSAKGARHSITHVQDWYVGDDAKVPKEQSLDTKMRFLAATNGYDSKDSILRLDMANRRLRALSANSFEDHKLVIQEVLALSPNKNDDTIASALLMPVQGFDSVIIYPYD